MIMKTLQKILTLFIGIGAVAGAVMMWIDPTGVSWGGEPLLVMLRDNIYFVLGLVEVVVAVFCLIKQEKTL